jgi:hypothetical protein
MTLSEWRKCFSRPGFGREVVSKCETITQYAPKDIFNLEETALFYNAQPRRTLALKGQNCQGGKGYKDRVTVLLCCNAGGSKKLCPLIVGKFEKPHCLKCLKHWPCKYKSSKTIWMQEDCLESGWSLSRGKWCARTGMCLC